jgi:hypothetical protein
LAQFAITNADEQIAAMYGGSTMAPSKPLRSNLGWSTPEAISVYGKNLTTETIGCMDLGGVTFLGITGRVATPSELRVLNAFWSHW